MFPRPLHFVSVELCKTKQNKEKDGTAHRYVGVVKDVFRNGRYT